MDQRPIRVLYIHNALTRFVQIDLQLLQRHFQVTERYIPSPRQNFLDLAKTVRKHDLILGWFASWHTIIPVLLARFFRKPSILIVGGYDSANLPEANYGSQRGGLPRLVANLTMQQVTHLVTHSKYTQEEVFRRVDVPAEKVMVIYLGLPVSPVCAMVYRERAVLTVGGVKHENLLRKGLLPFVQTAAFLRDVQFMLVGKWYDNSIDILRNTAGPNVEFCGFVTDEELEEIYGRSSVYVQQSLHEGFGMSVAEAMLAGCIPVVTRNGSLPEVVGDTGVYCASDDPKDIASAVRCALAMNGEARKKTRERIIRKFPLEKREEALVELIERALRGN